MLQALRRSLILVICLVSLLLTACVRKVSLQASELAVAPMKHLAGPIDIKLYSTQEFDGLMRQQILSKRAVAAKLVSGLLQGTYNPNPVVFSQIEDYKPWWGLAGASFFGTGEKSVVGDSEESRFILNPYLLVAANSWSAELFNPEKYSDDILLRRDFPFFWMPSKLVYYPNLRTAQILYNITDYIKRLDANAGYLRSPGIVSDFGLVAYNARDFGYEYLAVTLSECHNIIAVENNANKVVQIRQMIHCGGSSGYPGGCNNMSPSQEELDHFRLKNLPATLKVKLWKVRPVSVAADAEMVVMLEFR